MHRQESEWRTILTHKPALRSVNVWQMVIFEWVLFAYYAYALISGLSGQGQVRIVLYCIVFLLFDKLELTYKYLELEDPLHLGPAINCVRYFSYLCILNISLLLVRIVLNNQNIHAFMIVMHFILIMVLFLNDFSKKNTKLDINVDSNNLFPKFLTPITLIVLAKTNSTHPHNFWYLQLPFFVVNLFISSELNRLLVLKECQYFGWLKDGQHEKGTWSRKRSMKSIIVSCCIVMVTQNVLLLFDRIKYQISVTIIHSFIVATMSYLLYLGKIPSQK